jgi:hypothetical protein
MYRPLYRSRLLRYVEERGFFQPSQGDIAVALELFTLCAGKLLPTRLALLCLQ